METQAFEDVSPIKIGDFTLSLLVSGGVYVILTTFNIFTFLFPGPL